MTYPKAMKNQALELYVQGASVAKIARELGLNYWTVYGWLKPSRQEWLKNRGDRLRGGVRDEYQREWRAKNIERLREYRRTYQRDRRASDTAFRILGNLRVRLRDSLSGKVAKSASTEELLGCSIGELIQHWDSVYGCEWRENELHVDHIRPCSSFDFDDQGQHQACFFWGNLQLLPPMENRSKGCRWTIEDEIAWAWRMRSLGYKGNLYLVFLRAIPG